MRRLVVLLGLCACNQVFGLDSTHLPDSLPIVTSCPAIGKVPTYASVLDEALDQYCSGYVIDDAQQALAFCIDDVGNAFFGGGPPAGPLTALPGFDDLPASAYFIGGAFSIDGQEALAIASDFSIRIYHPQSGGSWRYAAELPVSISGLSAISAPTRAPMRRVLAIEPEGNLHELVEQSPDSWVDTTTYMDSDLGVNFFDGSQPPTLSPDGLRMIVQTTPVGGTTERVLYGDRAAVTDPFSKVTELEGVPFVSGGNFTISPDCSRIYFWALQLVFYVEQD